MPAGGVDTAVDTAAVPSGARSIRSSFCASRRASAGPEPLDRPFPSRHLSSTGRQRSTINASAKFALDESYHPIPSNSQTSLGEDSTTVPQPPVSAAVDASDNDSTAQNGLSEQSHDIAAALQRWSTHGGCILNLDAVCSSSHAQDEDEQPSNVGLGILHSTDTTGGHSMLLCFISHSLQIACTITFVV